MILRVTYLTLCGLLLAGIVHILVVLLIPRFGTQDAPAQISRSTELWKFTPLEDAQTSLLSDVDPFFRIGACRYDLSESPLLVEAEPTDAFWSAALFDNDGKVYYSLNERTTIGNRLRLLLVNPVQMASLRELQPEDLDTSIVAEARNDQGFLVLRVLAPDESWTKNIKNYLGSISCKPYEINISEGQANSG